jgi:hypothetical protein
MSRIPSAAQVAAALVVTNIAGAAFAAEPGHEEATYDQRRFLYVNDIGDLHAKKTSNDGPLHVFGNMQVSSSDYTRGAQSGLSDDSSTLSVPIDLSAVFEIAKGRESQFDQMAFTLGASNDVASDTPDGLPPDVTNVPRWYKSNYYLGFSAHLVGEWIGSLTYSVFTSPDELLAPTGHEAALTARYIVGVTPQLKLVEPTDSAPGTLASFSIRPKFSLGDRNGLKLFVPVEVGTGWDDYYGPATGSNSYGSVGVTLSVPFGSKQYGVWNVTAGADAVYRNDTIAALDGPLGDHDNLVWDASVAVRFYY